MQATATKLESAKNTAASQPQDGATRFELARPRWYTIGRLGPLVLLLWVVTDLGLRLLPPQTFGIHPWQFARIGAGRFAPFAANLDMETTTHIAAAATAANVPPVGPPVHIRFRTNQLGFRAVPGLPTGAPRLLMMGGSSFGYGYGLSDEHTLAAVIQRELQIPVFNSSRFFTDPDGLVEFDHLLRDLPAKPEAVVYLYLEQQDLHLRGDDNPYPETDTPPLQSLRKLGNTTIGAETYRPLEERYLTVKRSVATWLRLSPMEIVATRWQKRLANDRILPNTDKNDATSLYLPDGTRVLFDFYEWRRATQTRTADRLNETASYITWLRDRLRDRGLDMYVVMIPDKSTVYRDLLQGPSHLLSTMRRSNNPTYMSDLHEALTSRGISAVDGLSVMRSTAAADVNSSTLAYYLDDSHWNALGVDRIGRAAAALIKKHTAIND